MSTVWFDDPKQLFETSQLSKFWPTYDQSVTDRVNATSRFIIYVSLVILLIQKDPRILVLAAVTLGVLYVFYKSGSIIPGFGDDNKPRCTGSTLDNPMGNVLLSEYTTDPNRPAACVNQADVKRNLDDTFVRDAADIYGSRNGAARAFYTMPNTTIPNDQESFLNFLGGHQGRGKPTGRPASASLRGSRALASHGSRPPPSELPMSPPPFEHAGARDAVR